MLNDTQLNELILTIKQLTDPEYIYLFGSYSNNSQKNNSDIDIAIIKNNIANKKEFIVNLEKQILSPDYSVDLLVFSENEFQTKLSQGWKLLKEITTRGKICYAK
jgi:uncharacterized protein